MKRTIFYMFVIICASLVHLASTSTKYANISDCYTSREHYPRYNRNLYFLTFTCDKIAKNCIEHDSVTCGDKLITKDVVQGINFKNCHFCDIKWEFFEEFHRVWVLDISDVELETIDMTTVHGAITSEYFIASHNRLVEFPCPLFAASGQIIHVDFSDNAIARIEPIHLKGAQNLMTLNLSQNHLVEIPHNLSLGATNLMDVNLSRNKIKQFFTESFVGTKLKSLDLSENELLVFEGPGLTSLERLNLSYNQITQLDAHIFCETLLSLDLSHNNLNDLPVFENNMKTTYLDLSFNPIKHVNIETFANLMNLQELNLKQTNLSNIELGTFSFQIKLVSLDLSENQLKSLDFRLFLPSLPDLKTLRLAGNQLKNLSGLKSTLFPRLNLLDIRNNKFKCSYLADFIQGKSLNWENTQLALDLHSVDVHRANIRGINCDY